MSQAPLAFQSRNPDVLTCIANLSNDEVFTPPELANAMLDIVERGWAAANNGANVWADRSVRFLDPFTKSGVFLREITKRLVSGLEQAIPDLDERVDHVLTKQVFGIAITELTSLLARRSVYCSKWANGDHSIAKSFQTADGNIWHERTEHVWNTGKCAFCGAAESEYKRGSDRESHAYAFIHTKDAGKLLAKMFGAKMKFDVIIGNPPYQLATGGTGGAGVQAKPIYNLFVEQAKALDPRLLCMVTPSRWFSGGMGLDGFREAMLHDDRLRTIVDYPDSNDVFPGTQIKGGISYFLWDRGYHGDVLVTTRDKGVVVSTATRPLLESGADIFIRYNEGVGILKKVMKVEGAKGLLLPTSRQFMTLVSSIGAFGLDTTFRGRETERPGDVLVYRNGGTGYIGKSDLTKEVRAVDWWKVFIPRAGSGSDAFPHSILGKPFVGGPGTASSWTYMHIGPFKNKHEAENARRYITTRFFRFLVLLHKPTQDATRAVYTFVPIQDFSRNWSDEDLFARYGISADERDFIEAMIRPMETGDGSST